MLPDVGMRPVTVSIFDSPDFSVPTSHVRVLWSCVTYGMVLFSSKPGSSDSVTCTTSSVTALRLVTWSV
jgi:hypothetical protein